ncbi:hypothetical protein ACFL7E_08040 [Thermodesulfobacteriota bacterium]
MVTRWIRSLICIFMRTVARTVAGAAIVRYFWGWFLKKFPVKATDWFLDFLLKYMDLTFLVCPGYSMNIEDFRGRYLFRTNEETKAGRPVVAGAVTFENGDMKVDREPEDDPDQWDVRVKFENAEALRAFIFSKDQDILESLLENKVELDGNLNYIYKFGFMARDLLH